jgi:uncharacterized protein (TIGR02452 family)
MDREIRKKIYQETQQFYYSHNVPIYESIKYKYIKSHHNTKKYNTQIKIYNMDTLDCAIMLKSNNDYNICILNMANPYCAGGGVENGAIAQEESLFRRSNYFQTLNKRLYPIKENELIYSPIVDVSRKSEKELFTYYEKSYQFAFIASCAPIDPYIEIQTYQNYYQLMYQKICHILDVAEMNGHDCVILGALGCGAFNNPPYIVADIFKDVLPLYNGCFKEIAFAILKGMRSEDGVYGKDDKPDNYDIFTTTLL